MISPKLQMLQRQLARSGVTAPDTGNRSSDRFMEAVEQVVTERAEAEIRAVNILLEKAKAEVVQLKKQVTDMQKEHAQIVKELRQNEETHKDTAQKMYDKMDSSHKSEMQRMQNENTSLRKELASEQQARVRAEAQKENADKMCTRMEQMVEKSQAVKPVAPAPMVAPMKPMPSEFRVKRDEFGHIVSVIVMPSS